MGHSVVMVKEALRPHAEYLVNAGLAVLDERQLSAIVLMIAFANCANRINATIRHSLESEIS